MQRVSSFPLFHFSVITKQLNFGIKSFQRCMQTNSANTTTQLLKKPHKLYPVTPVLFVPPEIVRPLYARAPYNPKIGVPHVCDRNRIEIKSPKMINQMRKACEIASYIRSFAGVYI
jgi:hypothetical protein